MHRKLYSLVITGIIAVNTVCSTGNIYANNIDIEKDSRLERTSSQEQEGKDIDVPKENQWATFTTVASLEGKWSYEQTNDGKIKLKSYLDGATHPIVEIPRIIDGKQVELEGLNGGAFRNVTHIRVAKGDGYKVKLLATDLSGWNGFHQTGTLKYADFSGLDTSGLTNLYQAFSYSSSIEYVDLSDWDVSKVTNSSAIFYNCPNLKSINLSGWNIKDGVNPELIIDLSTKVNNIILKNIPSLGQLKRMIFEMRYGGSDSITLDVSGLKILENETSLNGVFSNGKVSKIIGLDTWDTSNVTNMSSVFQGSSGLKSVDGIQSWKTSRVTDMNNMFRGCSSLTTIKDIEGWDTSQVTNMKEIFRDCNKLQSLDLRHWKMSRVANIESMFLQCRNLTDLNVSDWDTSHVTNMNWLFEDCKLLTEIQGINTWNTSSAESMQGVFQRCNKLDDLDLSHWTTTSVNNISYMFKGCTSLSSLNVSNWGVSNISNMVETFMNTPSLNLINLNGWSLGSNVNTSNMFKIEGDTAAKILIITDNQTLKDYDYSSVNRIPAKVTVQASNGEFATVENTNREADDSNQRVKQRFTITQDEYDDIDNTIKGDFDKFGQPTRDGYEFAGWIMTKKPTSKFDMLDMTYKAVWKNTNEDGGIEIPGFNGGEIVIKPNEDGQLPSYDNNGNITLPQNSTVQLPNIGNVTAQQGTINPDNGELTLPSGGSIGESITVPNGSIIKPDGSIVVPENENITIQNGDRESIKINTGTSGQAPTINPGGNIVIPESGATVTVSGDKQVIVPQGTTVTPDGNITISNGGEVTLPEGIQVTVPQGSVVESNATITIQQAGVVTLPGGKQVTVPDESTINIDASIVIPDKNLVIKPNGSITVQGANGSSNITISQTTNENTITVPSINEEGEITLPNEVNVELQNGGNIVLPQDTVLKPNGEIVVLHGQNITIPQENGNNVVIRPGTDSGAPIINEQGNITIPSGSIVELQGGTSITVTEGIVNPENGKVTLQNGGLVELPNSSGTIQLPNDSTVDPDGYIVIPENSEVRLPSIGIIIKSNENGEVPTIDKDGNMTMPENGKVEITDVGTVVVPQGSVVRPNGSIIVSNGGEVTLPNTNQPVTVNPGTVINPDGTIKNTVIQSIMDKIDREVVDIVGNGDGQANNPIILTVKDIDKAKLNTFLNNLKQLNPKVTTISKGSIDIEYKLEVDNNNILSKAIEKTYLTIKVDNKKTDLIKALNKFSKGTNSKVDIPIITSFTDTTKHWAKANIESFASMGILNGYENGTFKPDAPITRAEFVKIINSVFGYTEVGEVTFTDVKEKDWFYKEVAIAKKAGYINGKTETTFAPNDKITRQEVAKILTTIMKNKDDKLDKLNTFPDGNKTADWAKSYVEGAIEAGYLSGDTKGYLNPTNNITRAEAVTVLSRLK